MNNCTAEIPSSAKHYRPLQIKLDEVCGIEWAIKAMRLPKGTEGYSSFHHMYFSTIGPRDAKLASGLVKAGNDHAKAMRGIWVYMTIQLQVGFMIEFETYRIGAECLSTSSTMHCELKQLFGEELAEEKQKGLVDKVYTRAVMISYQALRAMYGARKNHKHPDWQIFCRFVETLPYFDVLIYPEWQAK